MHKIMQITGDELGLNTDISVRIVADEEELYERMARDMLAYIARSQGGSPIAMIVPVGPIGQYARLAELCNTQGVSCKNVVLINMDEYCDQSEQWVDEADPISFRGFMKRNFFSLLDEELRPLPSNCIFPDPENINNVEEAIARVGGVSVVFGGLGINGHIAFNEPALEISIEEYCELGTRVLELAPETKVINAAMSAGGNMLDMPSKCITVGLREILSAKAIKLYCFQRWQAGPVRQMLHGPQTTSFPASLLQRHPDVTVTITRRVTMVPTPSVRYGIDMKK